MLTLESKIKLDAAAATAPNLATRLSEVDRRRVGSEVASGYRRDLESRRKWEERTAAGMDLAMQITEEKTFPWPNCANVAFPLVTIAALQFHARAYPSIISGSDVVKCKAGGFEPTAEEEMMAAAVSKHMSYQVLEEDAAWEEGQDRLLLNYSIIGCAFKKSYYSAVEDHNVSEFVLAQDLVLDYYAKSVETCRRKTHRYPASRNELLEGMRTGKFIDHAESPWFKSGGEGRIDQDAGEDRTGTVEPSRDADTPFILLEQHVWFDLDGDGFEEPYVAIIERGSEELLRIVARWERPEDIRRNAQDEVYSIRGTEYFTKYGFIPSPDGSIYDMGFGVLLGPLNESVSSAINQLLDAGTMSISAGGFLGRGAKIRGGVYTFAPFEWKRVDSTGEDLAKSIFPLPIREPSVVLFNLLGLLIDYTNRISGATETMVGENPGQNTPAETSRGMIEQGMKVYNAIFKRCWRSMKEEFKKLYILNGFYAPIRYQALYKGDPNRICPAADPNIVSDSDRMTRAGMIAARATTVPGYDPAAVEENFLRAMKVDNWKRFYVGFDPASQPKDPRIAVAEMKAQTEQMKFQGQMQLAVAELMEEQRLNQATMVKMQAEVTKILAEAEDASDNREIVRMQMMISAMKTRDESIRGRIDQLIKLMDLESKTDGKQPKRGDASAVRRMVGAPDDSGAAAVPAGGAASPGGAMA